MITNATSEQLNRALEIVNVRYDGNIAFKDIGYSSPSRRRFTLKARDCHGKGGRWNPTHTRHVGNCACWHVHGHFFEALFKEHRNIWVRSQGQKIDVNGGNWKDRNIGSQYQPCLYSEACDCEGRR